MLREKSSFVDTDEDEPSEATIQLNAKMTAQFRKAFPLKSEHSHRRPVPIATPSLKQVSKRLNFDDSLNTSFATSPSIKVIELTEEVESLKRQLSNAHADIERLKRLEKNEKDRVDSLQTEILNLRKELVRKNHNTDADKLRCQLNEIKFSRDEWQEASSRFHRYFRCALSRLTVAEKEIRKNGLLTQQMKMELSSAWTTAEYSTADIGENLVGLLKDASSTLEQLNQDDNNQENLVEGSEHDETEEISTNDTAMIMDDSNGIGHDQSISPIRQEPAVEEQSILPNPCETILNSTLANTSIDYEKDERIQRLELENSRLQDRVSLLRDRAQKTMLMEEQMNDAKQRFNLLEKDMENILAEFNSLRSVCAKKLFDVVDTASQERANEIIKRMQSLSDEVDSRRKQLDKTLLEKDNLKNEVEELRAERNVLLNTIEQAAQAGEGLKNKLDEEKEERSRLARAVEEKNMELLSLQKELNSLSDKLEDLQSKLTEAVTKAAHLEEQLRIAQNESTDAGNNTNIFHQRNNPLQVAIGEERERKRKAEAREGDESPEAKRARDEQISALEAQLKKSEREKEQTIRLQAELAKKYREVTTTLTGYQIKLKDVEEGICYVNSIYDEMEKQFVFKINADSGIVDLLDIGQDASSQDRLWDEEMRRYIGGRHSIPAFLASVTLQLEARRNLEDVERTCTITVLQED